MDLLATMALDRDAVNTVTLRLLPPSASTPSPSPSSPGSGGAAATASSNAPETASPWLLIHTIPITASLSRTLSRLVSIEDAAMAQAAAAAGAGAGAGGVGVAAGRPSSGARVSCSSTSQSPAPSSSGRPMLLRSVASAAAPSAATLAEAAASHASLNSPCGTPAAAMAPAPGAVSSTKSASASAGLTELLTTPPPTRLRDGLTSGTQLDHPDAASAATATNSSVPTTPIHATAAAKPAATSSHTRRLRSLSSTSSSSAASLSSASSSCAASPSSSTSSCAPKRVSLLSPASEAVHRSCSTPETDRAGWVELVRVGYIVSEIHAYCILVKCQRAAQAAVMKAALEEGAALGLTAPVEFVSDARPVVVTHRTFAESRVRAVEPDGAVAAADAARGKERGAGAERWRADVHTTTLLEAITTVYPVRGGEPGDDDDGGAQRGVAGAAAGVADVGTGDDAERNGYASDEDGGTTRAGHHDPHRHHHHHHHDRREAHHALRLPPAATQSSASATPPPQSQPRARGATTADGVRKGAAPPPSRHASAAAAAAQHGNSSSSPACTSPSHALTPSLRGSPGRHAHTPLHLPISAGGGGGGATLSMMGRWGGRGSASAMAAAATTATMRGAVPLRGGEFCAICLDPLLPRACVTTLCQHAFHLRCYAQLPSGSAECPLCRFTVYDLLNDARCKVCGTYEDLWVCLLCGHVACGRARRDHQQDHFQASGHSCAWQSSTNRIRNLSSRMFLHQEVALLLGDDDSAAGEEEAEESAAPRRTSGAAAPTTASVEDATASASGMSAHPTSASASAAAAAARDAASSTGVQRARYMSWLDSPEDSELQAVLSESKEEAVAQYYTQFLRQIAEEQQRFYEARLVERRRRRERRHAAAASAENAATPPGACGTAASASTPTMSFTSVVRDERRQRRHVLADYVQGSMSLLQEAQRAYASMTQGLRATRDAAQQQVLLQSHLNAGMLAEAEQVLQRTQEAQRKGEKASQAKAAEEARLQARVAEALASL